MDGNIILILYLPDVILTSAETKETRQRGSISFTNLRIKLVNNLLIWEIVTFTELIIIETL